MNSVEKKFKTYKNDLSSKFQDKIKDLNNLTFNQEKFNSLLSKIISDMSLDESIDEEKKRDDNKENNKETKPQNQDQHASEQEKENEEMSIDGGLPDIENQTRDSDKTEEEFEIEDSLRPELRKKGKPGLADLKYKIYTEEFDEIIKAEDLESIDELSRLRKNLDQQLLQLKNFISKLANKLQRKLLAKQNRSWDFDLEEGLLDTSKLPRIIMDPFNSLSFKKEKILSLKIH